jgi:hypothetical protein
MGNEDWLQWTDYDYTDILCDDKVWDGKKEDWIAYTSEDQLVATIYRDVKHGK